VKRRLGIAAVCLLLGAIVNVLVAWGVTVFLPVPQSAGVRVAGVPADRWVRSDLVADETVISRGVGRTLYTIQGSQEAFNHGWWVGGAIRTGWPARSMEGWGLYDDTSKREVNYWSFGHPARLRPRWLEQHMPGGTFPAQFPLRPLGFGLVVNTLFYGILIWLTGFGFSSLKRARRRRRGRCAWCGYELRGLERCPECGKQA